MKTLTFLTVSYTVWCAERQTQPVMNELVCASCWSNRPDSIVVIHTSAHGGKPGDVCSVCDCDHLGVLVP